jgi:hypothetical protein
MQQEPARRPGAPLMEGWEPRSTSVRPASVGYAWKLALWVHGFGYVYVTGWRPTKAWAERAARRRYDRAQRRFERRNSWRSA